MQNALNYANSMMQFNSIISCCYNHEGKTFLNNKLLNYTFFSIKIVPKVIVYYTYHGKLI